MVHITRHWSIFGLAFLLSKQVNNKVNFVFSDEDGPLIEELSQAMSAYRNGDMGLNESAKTYGVPKATLKRHLDGSNKHANGEIKKLGRQQVLPLHEEEELVSHLLTMESMFFGVTRKELMKLAYEVAEKNGTPHGFNRVSKTAGKTWYKKFMLRHPEISLRQPEATSVARASGFNNEAVGRYFDLLENIIDEHKLTAMRIYNMDESGISVVQKSCQKVIGLKEKHQIGSISSAERGVNTTVVCCNNAAGQYVPPLVIFKRKRMPTELSNGAPPGSVVTCNDSGWMDAEVFTKWLQHFVDFVKPTADKKVLLVLDGHTTHVKNLKAIELARKENVIMLCLPPHTTKYNHLIEHCLNPCKRTMTRPQNDGCEHTSVESSPRTKCVVCLTKRTARLPRCQQLLMGLQNVAFGPAQGTSLLRMNFSHHFRT